MKVQFLGVTGTVTGSKYLVTTGSTRILLDCGLFQGYKQLRLRNWEKLLIAPSELGAVLLTHAHLDHRGYLLLLVRNGFRGKSYCSEATYDLCRLLLPDSRHLLEEDAACANRHGFSRRSPATPLHTESDAERSLGHFPPVTLGMRFDLGGGLTAELTRAGHILGAAIVSLSDGQTSIAFSGNMGRRDDLIMPPPSTIERADFLVVELTYGNWRYSLPDPMSVLGHAIRDTARRRGVAVMPFFSVGRPQALMYYRHLLKESGAISPALPIFLDSPMAKGATAIYHKHRADRRLTPLQYDAMCHAAKIINAVVESKALDRQRVPMVIIAASGMATGGRAAMIYGADSIKILGWLSHFGTPPKKTFITHGESEAANALDKRIENEPGWRCRVPEYYESVDL